MSDSCPVLLPELWRRIFLLLPRCGDRLAFALTNKELYSIFCDSYNWCHLSLDPSTLLCVNTTEKLLEKLKTFTELVSFTLLPSKEEDVSTVLPDSLLSHLGSHCTKLRRISISYSQLDLTSFSQLLGNCGRVEEVSLVHCLDPRRNRFTDSDLDQLFAHGHKFRSLDLRHWQLSDVGLRSLTASPLLSQLKLSNCYSITDSGIIEFMVSAGPRLTCFHLDVCRSISQAGLVEMFRNTPHLQDLRLWRCNLTDLGLKSLASNCRDLRSLSLMSSCTITDSSLGQVFQNCQNLEDLLLEECNITDNGLQLLKENCGRLRYLHIKNCERISEQGVYELLEGMKKANIVKIDMREKFPFIIEC